MKPKRQEDSSCVFAYYFCRGTCHRRDTAGKENTPKSLRPAAVYQFCGDTPETALSANG